MVSPLRQADPDPGLRTGSQDLRVFARGA